MDERGVPRPRFLQPRSVTIGESPVAERGRLDAGLATHGCVHEWEES